MEFSRSTDPDPLIHENSESSEESRQRGLTEISSNKEQELASSRLLDSSQAYHLSQEDITSAVIRVAGGPPAKDAREPGRDGKADRTGTVGNVKHESIESDLKRAVIEALRKNPYDGKRLVANAESKGILPTLNAMMYGIDGQENFKAFQAQFKEDTKREFGPAELHALEHSEKKFPINREFLADVAAVGAAAATGAVLRFGASKFFGSSHPFNYASLLAGVTAEHLVAGRSFTDPSAYMESAVRGLGSIGLAHLAMHGVPKLPKEFSSFKGWTVPGTSFDLGTPASKILPGFAQGAVVTTSYGVLDGLSSKLFGDGKRFSTGAHMPDGEFIKAAWSDGWKSGAIRGVGSLALTGLESASPYAKALSLGLTAAWPAANELAVKGLTQKHDYHALETILKDRAYRNKQADKPSLKEYYELALHGLETIHGDKPGSQGKKDGHLLVQTGLKGLQDEPGDSAGARKDKAYMREELRALGIYLDLMHHADHSKLGMRFPDWDKIDQTLSGLSPEMIKKVEAAGAKHDPTKANRPTSEQLKEMLNTGKGGTRLNVLNYPHLWKDGRTGFDTLERHFTRTGASNEVGDFKKDLETWNREYLWGFGRLLPSKVRTESSMFNSLARLDSKQLVDFERGLASGTNPVSLSNMISEAKNVKQEIIDHRRNSLWGDLAGVTASIATALTFSKIAPGAGKLIGEGIVPLAIGGAVNDGVASLLGSRDLKSISALDGFVRNLGAYGLAYTAMHGIPFTSTSFAKFSLPKTGHHGTEVHGTHATSGAHNPVTEALSANERFNNLLKGNANALSDMAQVGLAAGNYEMMKYFAGQNKEDNGKPISIADALIGAGRTAAGVGLFRGITSGAAKLMHMDQWPIAAKIGAPVTATTALAIPALNEYFSVGHQKFLSQAGAETLSTILARKDGSSQSGEYKGVRGRGPLETEKMLEVAVQHNRPDIAYFALGKGVISDRDRQIVSNWVSSQSPEFKAKFEKLGSGLAMQYLRTGEDTSATQHNKTTEFLAKAPQSMLAEHRAKLLSLDPTTRSLLLKENPTAAEAKVQDEMLGSRSLGPQRQLARQIVQEGKITDSIILRDYALGTGKSSFGQNIWSDGIGRILGFGTNNDSYFRAKLAPYLGFATSDVRQALTVMRKNNSEQLRKVSEDYDKSFMSHMYPDVLDRAHVSEKLLLAKSGAEFARNARDVASLAMEKYNSSRGSRYVEPLFGSLKTDVDEAARRVQAVAAKIAREGKADGPPTQELDNAINSYLDAEERLTSWKRPVSWGVTALLPVLGYKAAHQWGHTLSNEYRSARGLKLLDYAEKNGKIFTYMAKPLGLLQKSAAIGLNSAVLSSGQYDTSQFIADAFVLPFLSTKGLLAGSKIWESDKLVSPTEKAGEKMTLREKTKWALSETKAIWNDPVRFGEVKRNLGKSLTWEATTAAGIALLIWAAQ